MQVKTNVEAGEPSLNLRPDMIRYATRPNRASSSIGVTSASQRFSVIAAGTALAIALGGCGGGDADPSAEGNQLAASVAARASTAAAGTGGEHGVRAVQAPTDAALTERVHAAWHYALGGDTEPTTLFPCAGAARDIEGLSTLRARLAASLTTSRGACTAASQGTAEIGGRTVGVYKVTCDGLDVESANLVWNIPSHVEACWQGTGALWKIGTWNWSRDSDASGGETRFDLDMMIDPAPAQLTSNLYLTPGASALAIYPSSGILVPAYYMSNTWHYAPNGPGAGTPCSNQVWSVSVPYFLVGYLLTQTVQATGGYRRCI